MPRSTQPAAYVPTPSAAAPRQMPGQGQNNFPGLMPSQVLLAILSGPSFEFAKCYLHRNWGATIKIKNS